MQQQSEIKEFWNKHTSTWKKWSDFIMEWHRPIGDTVISLAEIKSSCAVLDIGTGMGEPGLTLARRFPEANVIGIDISEEMIKTANENAVKENVNNYSAHLYEGLNLPFEDSYFDVVVSRNGIIFSTDLNATFSEIYRVLKNFGRVSLSGWGPVEKNELSTLVRTLASEVLEQTLLPLDSPGPFRFSQPGSLMKLLQQHGFTNIKEEEVNGTLTFDSPEFCLKYISETLRFISEPLAIAEINMIEKFYAEYYRLIQPYQKEEILEFKWSAIVARAEKLPNEISTSL